MNEVSTFRTYLLRGMYLLIVVGLAVMVWPGIVGDPKGVGHAESAMRSLLGGVSVLALIGLLYPLKMLPLLLFEFVWKVIWVLAFGLRLWAGGSLEGEFAETMFNCLFGIVLVPLVLPWRYLYQTYVRRI